MSFLNRVQRGVDTARFKADQILRVNRVQSDISRTQRQISQLREQIVDTVLSFHINGAITQQELIDLCCAIGQHEAQIAESEALILSIRAETLENSSRDQPTEPLEACPQCQFRTQADAAFCPNCGHRFAHTEPPDTQAQQTQNPGQARGKTT